VLPIAFRTSPGAGATIGLADRHSAGAAASASLVPTKLQTLYVALARRPVGMVARSSPRARSSVLMLFALMGILLALMTGCASPCRRRSGRVSSDRAETSAGVSRAAHRDRALAGLRAFYTLEVVAGQLRLRLMANYRPRLPAARWIFSASCCLHPKAGRTRRADVAMLLV
jgi:hypothetical protein